MCEAAEDDFIVEREVAKTLAPAPAHVSAAGTDTKSEGSSAGAVIGAILAILAVVVIAAVTVPKPMEQR